MPRALADSRGRDTRPTRRRGTPSNPYAVEHTFEVPVRRCPAVVPVGGLLIGPTTTGTAVRLGVDARRRRSRSGVVSRQIAQQRRGYAVAVLRALARTHRGRPVAVVRRVLGEASRRWVCGCPAPNFTTWRWVSAPGSRSPCREHSGRACHPVSFMDHTGMDRRQSRHFSVTGQQAARMPLIAKHRRLSP